MRRWSAVVALGLAPVLLGACAQKADSDLLIRTGGGGGDTSGPPVAASDPETVVRDALKDVTTYWQGEFPKVYGGQFRGLKGFYPYGPDTAPPPCGKPPPDYDKIADNAFYCPSDDIIAWDAASLIPRINHTYGKFTVAIVMAHEFGHAVQRRAGAQDRSVDLELQADCFAGAWTAQVAAGRAAHFTAKDVNLDQAVAGIVAVRDEPGISPDDPAAHGSGFDRVGSFQDGYENGAERCVGYADPSVDRRTAEIAFGEGDTNDGNLHLEDRGPDDPGVLSLATKDLNQFYGWLFDQLGKQFSPVADLKLADPAHDTVDCDGSTLSGKDLDRVARFCRDQNTVLIDGTGLINDLDDIGDFAVTSEMAQLWALSAQAQLGTVDHDRADLQADCLTGVWAASTFPNVEDVTPDSSLQISAGDLDEGIIGFLFYGQALGRTSRSAFERTEALRTGVFGGYVGCKDYGPLD
jgi:predicted metalloprotease